MSHKELTDAIRDQAASYALGLMDPENASAFEAHLKHGCPVCEAEVREYRSVAPFIALAVPQHEPHPRVKKRLLESVRPYEKSGAATQVWKAWVPPAAADIHVVRAGGEWVPTAAEGVKVRQLYVDGSQNSVTMLVRMEAGSTYPAHRHGGPEQCFVLEGDVRVGDLVLHAGDYQCAQQHTVHQVTSTEKGCLLLIVSSQTDELLA